MDVLNKLKNAVTNVLPGNPLSRDFDIYHQVASAGPGLLWKVYAATKKSTKEEASVFLFEKKSVERYSRRDRDATLELLRGGVLQLTKLRHPKILAVIQPLEESRESLAFATEPVFASLANVLGNMTSMSSVPKDLQEYQLYDVEIKHGLLQLTEGLGFLHNDAKMMHRNLCPESIVLSKLGSWKLAGCEFCIRSSDPQSSEPSFPFQEWRSDVAPVTQPNLDFMAPEYVLTMQCGTGSDMFSLGLLIYTIFAKGKPLFECNGEMSSFKSNAEELRHMRVSLLGAVPEELRDHVKLLLNTEPTVRPDAAQLSKVPFFEDMGCVTLQYIDTLYQRQNIEKSNFFKGLPKIIAKLPKRVSLQRIMPALFKEAMNPDMVPFLLSSILLVAEQATDMEYKHQILPQLVPLFKLKEPIQVVLLFLQNMNLLLSKTPKADIQSHVLPMLFRALEADSPQIQELCLSIIPTFADLIEYPTLKNSLVPRIKKLCLATSVLTVRVNCLLCLGQLMDYMDKWFVLDEVLPYLPKIPTREPAVLMSILGIHKVAFESSKLGITKDALANKVLPFLIPIALDNNLNLSQFNAFMALIRDMLTKMESEHRVKLEQLDQLKQEQKSLEITRMAGTDGEAGFQDANSDKNTSMMGKFLSGFGLSGFMSSQQHKVSSPSSQNPAAGSPIHATSGGSNSPGSPGKSNPVLPANKKTSLTLEEKQLLAKKQEQQKAFKAQPSISPMSANTTTKSTSSGKSQNSGSRDLTSTLMESNMNAMKSMNMTNSPRSSYPTTNTGWTSGPSWPNNSGMSMGMGQTNSPRSSFPTNAGWTSGPPCSNNSTMSMGGGFNANQTSGMGFGQTASAFGMHQMGTGFGNISASSGSSQQSKIDMSAFDSLMDSSSQKPKLSMNQMSAGSNPVGGMRPTGFAQPQPMGMMGMNSVGMAGNNSMSMGRGSMGMGGATMMGMPVQQPAVGTGMMMSGQMGMGGPHNAGFGGQPILTPSNSMGSSRNASSNSLDDLLG